MDDVQVPQLSQTIAPGWHFFGRYQTDSFHDGRSSNTELQLSVRSAADANDAPADANSNSGSRSAYNSNARALQASYASYASRGVSIGAQNDAPDNVSSAIAGPSLDGVVSLPGMPVFVLNSGTMLSVSGYGYSGNRITYSLIGGGSGVISADDVDWTTTTRLNAQRGLRVTLQASHATAGSAGF